LLAAFHGATDHIKIGVCSILGIGLAEREAQARVSTEGRSKHTIDTSEESVAKRARVSTMPSMAESLNFGSVINPTVPIHCIVQVNDGAPVGNLDIRQAARNFQLFLDAGQYHSPSIGLRVRDPGPGSSLVGRVNWHVDSRIKDQ